MKEEKEKRNKILMKAAMAIMTLVLVIILLYLITQKKETRISNADSQSDISALICTTSSNESVFFVSESANSLEHELKLVYTDGQLKMISYNFKGEFSSNESAKHNDAVLHAKYNTYMGEHEISAESLTPVFMVSENKFKIMLYLDDYAKMNSVFGRLFYIGSGDINTVGRNSKEETKKYYENKGFSCIISD